MTAQSVELGATGMKLYSAVQTLACRDWAKSTPQFFVLQLRDDQARMAAVWIPGSNLRLEIVYILIIHNFQCLRRRRDSHVPLKCLSEVGNAGEETQERLLLPARLSVGLI